MVKVSAIITTFNRSNFLSHAIDSVFTQDFEDWELIILDNSSSDDTQQVVAQYQDARVRYYKHEPMGISRQRNLGVSLAQSEFVAFLDDDDVWLPCKLDLEFDALSNATQNVALVYGGFRFYDDFDSRWGEHSPELKGKILQELLWTRDPFTASASNPMLRKSCIIEAGGYDEKILAGEDWELYLRLSDLFEIECLPEIVLEIRQHTGPRLGQRIDAALMTDRKVYLRYRERMPVQLRARYLQKIGGKLARLGMKRRARCCLSVAVKLWPWNILTLGQWLVIRYWGGQYTIAHQYYRKYLKKF